MYSKLIASGAILALAAFAPSVAQSAEFNVKPLIAQIEQPGGQVEFKIENEEDAPSPMEFWIERIDGVDENGREIGTPLEDEFLIFPPSTIIPAKTTQTVRVQWLGEEPADYFLIVRRAPVKLQQDQSGFAVSVKFRVRVSTGAE